ncbi:hypothetical protein [Luteimonas terricola]|uniref:hypothetical protein n=2 Tax=Luteimonas terricola TaxID=645597 RepID=UPI001667BBA0|nr:hypothetical protein [Luteimonas terricola]
MDIDSIRPILSGLIGAFVAVWLTSRWEKSLPKGLAGKSNEDVTHQHKLTVLIANALFFTGLGIGLAMYKLGGYLSTDMTPLLVGFGFSGFMPILALVAIPLVRGQRPIEALYAFSVGQKSPMAVTYGILGVGAAMLPFGLYRLGASGRKPHGRYSLPCASRPAAPRLNSGVRPCFPHCCCRVSGNL